MHPKLRTVFDKSVERLQADDRVLAGLNFGSVGKSYEDDLSDVDPVFFVKDEDYVSLHSELRPIFESFCPPVVLWWPESGNNEDGCNYAVFFDDEDDLIQYDVNLMKASMLKQEGIVWLLAQCEPEHILFDKTGMLTRKVEERKSIKYSPDKLCWWIEQWWIYAYIHVKYLRRSHTFKLLYAQGMLFNAHTEVLRSLYTETPWTWWPDVAKRFFTPEHKGALLLYFGVTDTATIAERLKLQMDVFSRDAREACGKYGIPFPDKFEESVRRHFEKHIAEI